MSQRLHGKGDTPGWGPLMIVGWMLREDPYERGYAGTGLDLGAPKKVMLPLGMQWKELFVCICNTRIPNGRAGARRARTEATWESDSPVAVSEVIGCLVRKDRP